MKRTIILFLSCLVSLPFTFAQYSFVPETNQVGIGYRSASVSFVPDQGYRGFVEAGYTVGFGDYSINRFEVLTSHGYQFNPSVFLGGGSGLQFYKFDDTEITMPIFADFRLNFKEDGDIIPFMSIKLGYTFYLSSDDADDLGVYFAPSFGVKYKVTPRVAPHVSLGYTLQHVDSYDSYIMNGISIKIGIEF